MADEQLDQRVINVVDRYLAVVMVRELNQDIGWRGDHVIGRMIDYVGCLPEFQGGGNSNGAMIHQLRLMFDLPSDSRTQWAEAAVELLRQKSDRQYRALVAYVFYRKRPDGERDYHTNDRIAQLVDMSRSALHNNLQAAEGFILSLIELQRIERLAWREAG